MTVLMTPRGRLRFENGGAGAISGSVAGADGLPAERDIRISERWSGRCIRKSRSGADGTYVIEDLRPGLVVDVRIMDDDTGAVYNDLVHSGVVVA